MQEQSVTYVKQLRPTRRLEPGGKARRWLAFGLAAPALAFLLASARDWISDGWPTQFESPEEILPVVRASVALFLGGFAIWVWRDGPAETETKSWFLERETFQEDWPLDPVQADEGTSEPAA